MKKTKRLSISAVLTALSVAIMYIGALTGVLDISAVVIASFAVMLADFELRIPYNLMVYAGTSVLSFLILPNKQTALMYILFGGIYPIIKRYLCAVRPKLLSYALRVLSFELMLTAILWLVAKFFMLDDYTWIYSHLWIVYLVLTPIFLLYDYVIELVAGFYYAKIRPKIANLLT